MLSVARDDEPGPPTSEEAWGELNKIVAEAVIWQDKAEELLVDISHRRPLAELAPRGGPLIRRFFALRMRLPVSNDPAIRRYTEVLGPVLDHHALMINSSLDMLAADWRSERIVSELERIDGLGAPRAAARPDPRGASRSGPGARAGVAATGSGGCWRAAAG